MRRGVAVALLGLVPAMPAAAQSPRGFEIGVAGALLLAEPTFAGGGGLVALRPGGRLRLQLAGLVGDAYGVAVRGELSGQLLLTPSLTRGVAVYGLAGIAGTAGQPDAGYLLLGLGIEARPGGGHGWWAEAGVGGGARIALGWRWRMLRGGRR